MDTLAKMLIALSYKGIRILLKVTFVILLALGLWISIWIFVVPLALVTLVMCSDLCAFSRYARATSWEEALTKLKEEIRHAQEKLAADDVRADIRLERNQAELEGRDPRSHLRAVKPPTDK